MDTGLRPAFLLSIVFVASLYGDTAPCALVTQSQVSAVVGAAVGVGSPIANTGCSWSTTAPPKVTVTISMQSEKMFTAARSASQPGGTKSSISGVGDEAVFTAVQNFASLWVRKGAAFFLFRIYGLPVNDAQPKLKALATDALSKR